MSGKRYEISLKQRDLLISLISDDAAFISRQMQAWQTALSANAAQAVQAKPQQEQSQSQPPAAGQDNEPAPASSPQPPPAAPAQQEPSPPQQESSPPPQAPPAPPPQQAQAPAAAAQPPQPLSQPPAESKEEPREESNGQPQPAQQTAPPPAKPESPPQAAQAEPEPEQSPKPTVESVALSQAAPLPEAKPEPQQPEPAAPPEQENKPAAAKAESSEPKPNPAKPAEPQANAKAGKTGENKSQEDDSFESVMDFLVKEFDELNQEETTDDGDDAPATGGDGKALGKPLAAIRPSISSLQELVDESHPDSAEDYLLLSAYYLSQYESESQFSLKRINAMLVKSGLTPVNHSVLESALTQGRLYMAPDLTGTADVSEYGLTEEGFSLVQTLLPA